MAGAWLAAASCSIAHTSAAEFPERPMRLLVGQATGSATDAVARAVASAWSDVLRQSVIVDNRPGAGETIAAQMAASANADGYTNLLGSIASHGIAPAIYRQLPYDPLGDFAPLSLVGKVPNVLVVYPGLAAFSVADLARIAKASAGRLAYASTGVGTSTHLGMELLKARLGMNLLHVPYKAAGSAFSDLIAGEVAAGLFNLPSQLAFIQAGKVRALAVTSLKRNPQLPAVPTMDEAGVKGYEVVVWYAAFTGARTPKRVQLRLVGSLLHAMEAPQAQAQLTTRGVELQFSGPQELAAFTRRELVKWRTVVREAGIALQ